MTFPTNLDNFTNPAASDSMTTVSHSQQHSVANDAIEALQVKVGIDSSADTNSLDYKVAQNTAKVSYPGASSIIDLIYPVGSIYTEITGTNPGTTFGVGTWVAFGSGRVPVGYDAGQTEFDTVEETGGAKTHTLTETEMPAHTHSDGSYATNSWGGTGTLTFHGAGSATVGASVSGTGVSSSGTRSNYRSGGSNLAGANSFDSFNVLQAHSHDVTGTSGSTGSDGAHNNLQPYIVVHMWKRTA